jgi:hypothetical protein
MRLHNKVVAATIVATLSTAGVGVLTATARITASASTPPQTVSVTVGGGKLAVGSTSVPAGNVVFRVKSTKGDHTVQLLQLHSGYTKQQAKKDIGAAFGGNKAAIKRVDTKIDWLGGIDATPQKSNVFSTQLAAGTYYMTDQESNAIATLTVVSAPAGYRTLYPNAYVTTKGNMFHMHTNLALPHSGWVRMHNNAQEPHMFVLQHVKQSTTNKDVRDYIASGSQKPPSWGLGESMDAGVISPGKTQVFSYKMPAGKFLVACFWPSIDTGAPHFTMGMWKLVELS